MWKYFSISDRDKINLHNAISLHDCFVTKIIAAKDLIFEFADGFWIVETNSQNKYGQTLRTDKSQTTFTDFGIYYTDIYIFKKFSILRRIIRTTRIEISLEKLISNINNGKWRLEIIDEFHQGNQVLFNCTLEHRQQYMECQITFDYKNMNYFWNNICEDSPW